MGVLIIFILILFSFYTISLFWYYKMVYNGWVKEVEWQEKRNKLLQDKLNQLRKHNKDLIKLNEGKE
jgi:hypothetical protein